MIMGIAMKTDLDV